MSVDPNLFRNCTFDNKEVLITNRSFIACLFVNCSFVGDIKTAKFKWCSFEVTAPMGWYTVATETRLISATELAQKNRPVDAKYFVDSRSGRDEYDGLSKEFPFKTIKHALAVMDGRGGSLDVGAGYVEGDNEHI